MRGVDTKRKEIKGLGEVQDTDESQIADVAADGVR